MAKNEYSQAAVDSLFKTLGNMAGLGLDFGLGIWQNQMNQEWSENMYRKYQSPKAVMQQMIDAGINPNAAAQGISGSGPASLMNTSSQVSPGFGALGSSAVSGYYNSLLAQSEKENIDANTEFVKSRKTGQDIQNEWTPEQYKTAIDEAVSRINKNDADSENVKEQTRQLMELFPTQKELLGFKVNEVKEMVENIRKQREVMASEIRVNESQIGVNGAQKARLESETAINNYILENGYDPRSPEGKMIVKLSSDDPQERKEGERLMDAIVEVQDKADEELRGNDPIVQQEKELKARYEKDVARIDELLEKDKAELHEYEMKRKKDNWFQTKTSFLRDEIKRLEGEKRRVYSEYTENLRRLKQNESHSVRVGVASTSDSQ